MAALSISSVASLFSDEQKSLTRSENHYQSNHIESFSFSDGVIRGEVHASMKKKVYKVTVSDRTTMLILVDSINQMAFLHFVA